MVKLISDQFESDLQGKDTVQMISTLWVKKPAFTLERGNPSEVLLSSFHPNIRRVGTRDGGQNKSIWLLE